VFRRSAVLAAGFAALAGLVAAGSANGVDRWAIEHAMPGAQFSSRKPTVAEALVPLLHVRWHGAVHVLAEIVTLPAAFLPSLLLVAAVVWRTRAYVWALLWIAGNAVEELCKSTLTRPALYHDGPHLRAFDSSYPSGHTIRAVLLAAMIPAARPWAVAAIVLLEVGGFHVPTDIAGGLLLALALLAARRRLARASRRAAA
jgi:membrane-associated phospholipid phosphatase